MRRRTPHETEKSFMAAVCKLATLGGWRVYHPWLSVRSSAGFPDLVLVHREPGHPVLYVEVKLDGKQPTPAQQAWLEALAQATGTEVHCWRPADWPAIAARLLPPAGTKPH